MLDEPSADPVRYAVRRLRRLAEMEEACVARMLHAWNFDAWGLPELIRGPAQLTPGFEPWSFTPGPVVFKSYILGLARLDGPDEQLGLRLKLRAIDFDDESLPKITVAEYEAQVAKVRQRERDKLAEIVACPPTIADFTFELTGLE